MNKSENNSVLTLTELLMRQGALQRRMGNPTGLGEEGLKENLLHVMVETTEALREVNFKPWKAKKFEVDRQALATELTDILQFWANAALAMDLTAKELTAALRAKWEVNHQRIDVGDVVKCCEHEWEIDTIRLIDTCLKCGEERA